MDIAAFLNGIEAFRGLGPTLGAELAAQAKLVGFREGATIIRRGDPADCMYILATGTVVVPVVDDRGRTSFVAQLGPGQFFGEMALLTGDPRRANVIAATQCSCVLIPKAPLQALLQQRPRLAGFLTEILGQRLMEAGGVRQVGKYVLTGELGRGGISIVYEGMHPTLERAVAIKMLSHALVYDATFAAGFRNEARIIASLRHPNIVEVYDTEEAYATLFIIMEKLHGTDVSRRLRDGPLSHDDVRSVLAQAASALHHAHERGVVHRDVKPSNIAIEPNGHVKLMDFGLALGAAMDDTALADGMTVGTPAYMAPEQAMGRPVDARADIYSLGIVAFEMLTGQPPFVDSDPLKVMTQHVHGRVPPPSSVAPDVPPDLDEIVLRATAREPEERYRSCRELLDRLARSPGVAAASRSRARTVTLSYPAESEPEVIALVEDLRHRARSVPGLVVE